MWNAWPSRTRARQHFDRYHHLFVSVYSRDFEELSHEMLETERDTIIALRNEEAINDQALRRIQRDIDLAEARLQRQS